MLKLKKYIFTKGNRWFIDEFTSMDDAVYAYPDYHIELYISITQIPNYY